MWMDSADAGRFEAVASGDGFKKNDAQRKNVGAGVGGFAPGLFGRHTYRPVATNTGLTLTPVAWSTYGVSYLARLGSSMASTKKTTLISGKPNC